MFVLNIKSLELLPEGLNLASVLMEIDKRTFL